MYCMSLYLIESICITRHVTVADGIFSLRLTTHAQKRMLKYSFETFRNGTILTERFQSVLHIVGFQLDGKVNKL